MLLSEIIQDVEFVSRSGDQDPRIGKIVFDSRLVEEGDVFVAVNRNAVKYEDPNYGRSWLES